VNLLQAVAASVVSLAMLLLPAYSSAQKLSDLDNAPAPASDDAAQPVVTKVGDWNLICEPAGSPCAMTQLGNDPQGSPAIEFVIRKVEDESAEINGIKVNAVADIITPLGVLLEFGIRLKIDDQEERAAPFRICQKHGCLGREPLSEEVVTLMKKGNKALVTVVAEGAGPVEISVSLSGFTKAYGSL